MLEHIVWDAKFSVRHMDENGYLHIETTPISKATVNPYRGSELQGLTDKELDPDKIYYGYRDPEELAKGADTFNGLFLLDEHHNIDSIDIPREYIIGTVGTDARFKDGYLYNSLTIADAEAIKQVKDGTKIEISSAYRFTPVFKSGEVELGGENVHFDFVMTNIKGNHVALVPEGRAGHDVRVADSKENVMEEKTKKCPIENADMMNSVLDELGAWTLEDFKARVNGNDRYEVKVINEIKNSRGDVTAVICGSKEHQFIVGYDCYGHLDAEELINDEVAGKVREAVDLGKRAKEEEDNAKKAFKYDVQQAVKEQMECPVASAVAEAPTTYDPANGGQEKILANPEHLVNEALKGKAVTVQMVGDEAMVTAPNAGAPVKQSIVDEKGAKGMGDNIKRDDDNKVNDERNLENLKQTLSNTAYKGVDELATELKRWGVDVGLTNVVSAGESYSIVCTKGEKEFTVEYNQAPNCIEVTAIVDDGEADFAGDQEPDDDVTEELDETLGGEGGGHGSGRKKGSKNRNSGVTTPIDGGAKPRVQRNTEKALTAQKRNLLGTHKKNFVKKMPARQRFAEEGRAREKTEKTLEMLRSDMRRNLRAGIGTEKKQHTTNRTPINAMDTKMKIVRDAKPAHSIYELLIKILREPAED